jgi:hypothetical protein
MKPLNYSPIVVTMPLSRREDDGGADFCMVRLPIAGVNPTADALMPRPRSRPPQSRRDSTGIWRRLDTHDFEIDAFTRR